MLRTGRSICLTLLALLLCAPAAHAGDLTGTVGVKKNAVLKERDLLKAKVTVPVTCSENAGARVSLVISKRTAKALGIKTEYRELAIASGSTVCRDGNGTVTLKMPSAYKRKLSSSPNAFAASLTLRLGARSERFDSAKLPVKVR